MKGGRIVQHGTPQEIYTSPADSYVSEFVEHMNPLAVLRARHVMVPAPSEPPANVGPETPLKEIVPLVTGSDRPVGVVENEQLLGQVTRDSVLNRLMGDRQSEPPR